MSEDQLREEEIEEAWAKVCPCCFDPLHDCYELNCRGELCQWCNCPHCADSRAALHGDSEEEA